MLRSIGKQSGESVELVLAAKMVDWLFAGHTMQIQN